MPGFIKMPPGLYLGEGIGVATNSKGHVFVYTRSQPRAFSNSTKRVLLAKSARASTVPFAHAVRVDPQDNIWAVDEGTNMVIKFNPEGRVMMVLGHRPEAGRRAFRDAGLQRSGAAAQPYTFNRPTDVAWDAARRHFVSDGYGNSRVAKYDKNGKFIKSVGSKGAARPAQLPHTMAADAKGNVYVGDRSNSRIQVFDNDLNSRPSTTRSARPGRVCITPGPHQYLYSSNSNPDNNDAEIAAVTGEIYKMELDGTILGKFGKAGKASANSAPCTNWTAALRTSLLPRRSQPGECRNSFFIRQPLKLHRRNNISGEFNETSSPISCSSPQLLRRWPTLAAQSIPDISFDSAPNI